MHQAALAAVYKDWPRASKGPCPIWTPTAEHIAGHNVTRFMEHFKVTIQRLALHNSQPSVHYLTLSLNPSHFHLRPLSVVHLCLAHSNCPVLTCLGMLA